MAKTRITMQDIAREVGVSHTAVSKALRGASDIGPELTDRIRKLARKNNYYPRAAAQLLRGGKTNQIGLVVAAGGTSSLFEGDFLGPLLGHIISDCGERHLRYMFEVCRHDMPFKPTHLIHSGLVDGALLVGDVGDQERAWLDTNEGVFPWVSIAEPARFCVLVDGHAGAYQAARRIGELGHRRVAYAGGPTRYAIHRTSLAGFRQAVQDFGLHVPEDRQRVQQFGQQLTREANLVNAAWAKQILSQPDRPTAVICHGDTIARSVIYAAMEMGLSVPRDLSIVSWGSPWIAHRYLPALTTISVDYAEMAKRGMDMLEQRIDGLEIEQPEQRVTPHLVDGDTLVALTGGN